MNFANFHLKNFNKTFKVHQIFRERDILRLLSTPEHSHPFITRLYCTFQDSDCLYFVLTLAEKKDLLARLKASGGCLDLEKTRFVMAELCLALLHIHGLNVVHRDVKPGKGIFLIYFYC